MEARFYEQGGPLVPLRIVSWVYPLGGWLVYSPGEGLAQSKPGV